MGALRILQMTNCASAAGGAIGQLAASDRPNQTISAPIFVYQSQKDFDGYLQIDTNGNITAKYYIENSSSEWAVPQNGRVYGFVIWCIM